MRIGARFVELTPTPHSTHRTHAAAAFFPLSKPHLHYRPSLVAMASSSMSTMPGETLQVKRLSQDAVLPVRGSEWAAGYDLARWMCMHAGSGACVLASVRVRVCFP